MKLRLILAVALAALTLPVFSGELPPPAPPIKTFSYADVVPTSSDRLQYLDNNREVIVSAASGINSCSFATEVRFRNPDQSPMAVNFTVKSCTISVISTISGTTTVNLNNLSMALSKWNPEESNDTTKPNIYALDLNGNQVAPFGSNLVNVPVSNAASIFFTEHPVNLGGSFPRLVNVGDTISLRRTMVIEYTPVAGGITVTTDPLVMDASVQIVGNMAAFPQSSAPHASGELRYTAGPTPTTDNEMPATEVTVAGLDETWPYTTVIQQSTDLVNWEIAPLPTGGKNADGTWTFKFLVGGANGPRKFFRFKRFGQYYPFTGGSPG